MTEEERLAAEKAAQEAADKEAADKKAADEAAAAEQAEKDRAAAVAAAGNEEAAAALEAANARVAELQAIADSFAGLDPEKAKAAIAAVAEADEKAAQAEKDKAKAEGNFEKLRELQQAESQAAIDAANDRADKAEKAAAEALAKLSGQTISTAFAQSKFIADETILSGAKAQRLFADHVEIEDGELVVYDAPAGAAKRAKVMDSKGKALPFNDAIAKVINADPDKDELLKAKVKPGASSKTVDGKTEQPGLDRQAKLAAGLAALRKK